MARRKRTKSSSHGSRSNHTSTPSEACKHDVEVKYLVIGGGISGICIGVYLKKHLNVTSSKDLVILERQNSIGGTWFSNKYPGCACDIPYFLYTFSFLPAISTDLYAAADEIETYLRRCCDHFGLYPHIRCNQTVESAHWNDHLKRWIVTVSLCNGSVKTYAARYLFTGTGQLSVPKYPRYVAKYQTKLTSKNTPENSEVKTFRVKNTLITHSALMRKNNSKSGRLIQELVKDSLQGKRVAIIGNGSTGTQLVESLQPAVKHLYVFARSPKWLAKKYIEHIPSMLVRLFRAFPSAITLLRWLAFIITECIHIFILFFTEFPKKILSRQLLRACGTAGELNIIPAFRVGCSRMIMHSDYLATLTRSKNVTPILSQTLQGFDSTTGSLLLSAPHKASHNNENECIQSIQADVVIFATGFEIRNCLPQFRLAGRNGVALSKLWEDQPRAYLGISTPGFPNCFFLYGPNTNTILGSITFFIECACSYIVQAVQHLEKLEIATGKDNLCIEVKKDSVDVYYKSVLNKWFRGRPETDSCSSWYKTNSVIGDKISPTNFPGTQTYYWWLTRSFDHMKYSVDIDE